MFTKILKNKIFRTCLILIVILLPVTSKYRFVKTIGPSMHPTLKDGEWFVIEKRSSLGKEWAPKRFDSVVIGDKNENLCKRIIGLPGDVVEVKRGLIYLNGRELKDPFGKGKISIFLVDDDDNNLKYWDGPDAGEDVIELIDQGPEKIKEGYVWVIGDNRRDSWFGLLLIEDVVGKVLY